MNPAELKAVVEYMESERGVEREVIIRAIELALQSVAEKNGTLDSIFSGFKWVDPDELDEDERPAGDER